MSLESVGTVVRRVHSSPSVVDVAALLMRAVLGFVFVGHGAQKLFGWFGGGGVSGTTDFFTFIDVPARHSWRWSSGSPSSSVDS
jgi:putative oxidoreductase